MIAAPLPLLDGCQAMRSHPAFTLPRVLSSALAWYHAPGWMPPITCSAHTVAVEGVYSTIDDPWPGIQTSVHARPRAMFQPVRFVSNVPLTSRVASSAGAGLGVAVAEGARTGDGAAVAFEGRSTTGASGSGPGSSDGDTDAGSDGGGEDGGAGGGGGGVVSVITTSSMEKRAPAAVAVPLITTRTWAVPAGAVTGAVVTPAYPLVAPARAAGGDEASATPAPFTRSIRALTEAIVAAGMRTARASV